MAQFTPLARYMAYQLRRTCPPGTRIATVRQRTKSNSSSTISTSRSSLSGSPTQIHSFHSSARLGAYKNDQDKDSLKPGSSEYSKSGAGGDDGAASTDAAFDPSQTKPKEQGKNVEKENGGDENNSLDVSPANSEVSKGKGDGVEKSGGSDRRRTSGAGSAPKAGS